MANRHMKGGSSFLIIRDMPIKTIKRYHLTLLRMTMIKKLINNMLEKVWKKENPLTPLVGM